MADGIVIEVELTENIRAALDRLVGAGTDLTPAMKDIAGHLADRTRERFETGRGPTGVPWKPSQRVRENPGSKTLVDTTDLLTSIRENWGRDFAEAGPEASGGAARYAAIHQFGGEIRPKNGRALSFGGRLVSRVVMPARPYLGFTPEDADYALDVLRDLVARALGGGTAPGAPA